ncbi:RNA-directed DNA polymerase, eukaryota, partial [Tanacetum coccineum]
MLDKRPNDGVLFKNGSSVYALDLGDSKGNFSGRFCVARNGADYASLQDRLNWACGQGQSNCTAIQSGQPGYILNTIQNHASYTYNDYYQRKRDLGGTRDFGGMGILTNVDPSYGTNIFTGRLVDAFIANKLSKGDSVLLVKLKDIDSMSNMYTICWNEGFSDLNIHHVSGYWIWIQFPSSSACSKFQENESLKKLYSVKKAPSSNFTVDERIIWIEISGLPLCAWGSNAYKKIACSFGKFLFFEKEDSSALSSGRVCISSKFHGLIYEIVQVKINNKLFEATFQEIFSWCIKITDDYIDENIKEVDSSSESIDDHSVDDLEYIQTNLNNIVNQVFEQKMDNNEENKQGEEDIHLIVPQQPPKEEANNKESNPECKAESSDLSRPPSFEFMKKSSSPSSKCSTSFARFRKKDIKGVSLIHELNQIIDVGNSLGYDVRVVERGKEENACRSKIFALNIIMARGRSGGLISMWDPNFFSKESIWCDDSFIIIKRNWKNAVRDCYMVNIYGPQDQVSKLALWNR